MSDGNPPSFYRSFERFWEILAVVTFLIGIVAFLAASNFSITQSDGDYLLYVSIVSTLQAIYFDRKALEAETRAAKLPPGS
jgi:hypothetical protein